MKYKHTKTNGKKENEYPKLVRDKIPEIVEGIIGKKVKWKVLKTDKEYKKYLLVKIFEEVSEFENAKEKIHKTEEMADIMEILDALISINKLKLSDIRKIQKQKAKKRGGFEKRILMIEKAK
jgi:predicted house-cleaning noncanonical NTP pyrophosphatase (MazG superfamily)